MNFCELTISGNSNYDILDEEHETVYLNYIVWARSNKSIFRVKLIKVTLSDRKWDIVF